VRQPAQIKNQERVGANIRRLRLDRSMTQEDLAHAAGTYVGAISRLERGLVEPRLHTLVNVARALSVPAGELLRGVK
jgi:transcriptional regulator with XRE-family HTH domain